MLGYNLVLKTNSEYKSQILKQHIDAPLMCHRRLSFSHHEVKKTILRIELSILENYIRKELSDCSEILHFSLPVPGASFSFNLWPNLHSSIFFLFEVFEVLSKNK